MTSLWIALSLGGAIPDSTDSLRKVAEGLRPPAEDTTQRVVRRVMDAVWANDALLSDLLRATLVFLGYSVVGDPRHHAVPLREIHAGGVHTPRDLFGGFFIEGRALDFPGRMGGIALGASWLHFEDERTVLVVGWGGLVWTLGGRFFPLIVGVGGSYADASAPGYPLYGVGGYMEFQPFHRGLPVWPVVRYEHHAYTARWGYRPGNLWGWSWGVRGRLGPLTFFYLFRDLRAGSVPLVFRVAGVGVAG